MGSASFPDSHSSASRAGSGPGVSGYRSSWKRSDCGGEGDGGEMGGGMRACPPDPPPPLPSPLGPPRAHLARHRHDDGLALALVQLEEPARDRGDRGPAIPLTLLSPPQDPPTTPPPPRFLPGDFTLADIQPALGHEAHAPLRLLAAVGVQVVHVGCLVRDFEVPDAAVTLRGRGRVSTSPGTPRDGVAGRGGAAQGVGGWGVTFPQR